MKHKKQFLFLMPLLAVMVLVSGCSFSLGTKTDSTNDVGGVFISTTQGDTWKAMNGIPTVSGTPGSIAGVNVNKLVVDPSDNQAVYLAAIDDGLYYTYSIAKGWNFVQRLDKGTINDLAVDSKNKCVLFAAMGNKLYKSTDCSRFWKEVYYDNNPGVTVNAVAIDYYDNRQIYIGTSRGEVIKSLDGGTSWSTIQRLKDGVRQIILNPKDSRIVLVASEKSGMYKFNNNGTTKLEDLATYNNRFDGNNWTDLNEELKEFNLGFNFKGANYCQEGTLFIATDKVILRSTDNGSSWARIKLITPDKDTAMNAIAVNPADCNQLFYVTNTTFYKSLDGGVSWITKQLPTDRSGNALLVDPANPNLIYLGTKKVKTEQY
ncbi:MAG TPA: hypothetical protein PKI61_02495 [bacterium]|nr:hypothetical protein [bacterium]HPT30126.1 hypothetical protein [bacterium]